MVEFCLFGFAVLYYTFSKSDFLSLQLLFLWNYNYPYSLKDVLKKKKKLWVVDGLKFCFFKNNNPFLELLYLWLDYYNMFDMFKLAI